MRLGYAQLSAARTYIGIWISTGNVKYHDRSSIVLGPPRITRRQPGLLARSRTSEQPFGEFYDAMAPAVLRFFARRTRDSERAFDLTAETFAKAFEKRRDFRGHTDEQAAAWLWSIARNELARYSRTRKVELAAVAPGP